MADERVKPEERTPETWPTPVNRREFWPVVWSVLIGVAIGAAAVIAFASFG